MVITGIFYPDTISWLDSYFFPPPPRPLYLLALSLTDGLHYCTGNTEISVSPWTVEWLLFITLIGYSPVRNSLTPILRASTLSRHKEYYYIYTHYIYSQRNILEFTFSDINQCWYLWGSAIFFFCFRYAVHTLYTECLPPKTGHVVIKVDSGYHSKNYIRMNSLRRCRSWSLLLQPG